MKVATESLVEEFRHSASKCKNGLLPFSLKKHWSRWFYFTIPHPDENKAVHTYFAKHNLLAWFFETLQLLLLQ